LTARGDGSRLTPFVSLDDGVRDCCTPLKTVGGEWRSCSVATNTVMLRGVPFAFSWRSGLRSVRVSHLDVVVHGEFERRRPDAYGGPACAVQNAGEAALSLEDRVLLVSALRIRILPLPLSFSLVPLFLLALTLTCAAAPPPPSGARVSCAPAASFWQRVEVRGRPRAAEKGASTGPSGESDAGFPRAGDGGCTVNGDVTISRGPGGMSSLTRQDSTSSASRAERQAPLTLARDWGSQARGSSLPAAISSAAPCAH
jgi:hypothetical protein